ncbi:MAG: endonuclease [Ignavibacteriales bacterium UTCHB2]|jgi:putative endonuclease|nr:MAG: GIY-YIG nuclease superfamily protein [Ignavibacteria bacterium ADurb.Bin266]OQY75638.1 MAG: endonuclease [Ignavibacteriales bacterium UTCHB2]HQI40299.1 GIY-YIG nuclease family protein [Ignavibacteriaceae bacterium]
MFYTYILKSKKDGSYYYGSTQDIEQRLRNHNSGKVRYTKGHMPYKVHYFEVYQTRKESMRREKFFKTIDGYNWLKLQKII